MSQRLVPSISGAEFILPEIEYLGDVNDDGKDDAIVGDSSILFGGPNGPRWDDIEDLGASGIAELWPRLEVSAACAGAH